MKSGEQVVKTLARLSFKPKRRKSGSHVVMLKEGHIPFNVPQRQELKPGTLRGIINYAGITRARVQRQCL
ncbi:type II toxin-antitoxin system HicA family toxin, partial [Candidatus Bathyarchaeota archaeon]|nr:type II toxin-antitoxin system HicA family toxin [Candidatus Bathyarchaeota archaeon]